MDEEGRIVLLSREEVIDDRPVRLELYVMAQDVVPLSGQVRIASSRVKAIPLAKPTDPDPL
jgi:hypothetical protein